MLNKTQDIAHQIEQIFTKPKTISTEEAKIEQKQNPLCKRFFHQNAEGDFLNLFNGLNMRVLSQNENLLSFLAENYKIDGTVLNLQIVKEQIVENFETKKNKIHTLPSYISTPIDPLALSKSVLLLHFAPKDSANLNSVFQAIENAVSDLNLSLHLAFPLNFVVKPQSSVPEHLRGLIPQQSFSVYKDATIDYQDPKSVLLISTDEPGRIRVDQFTDFKPHDAILQNGEDGMSQFHKYWSYGVQSARSFFSEVAFQMGYFEKFGA